MDEVKLTRYYDRGDGKVMLLFSNLEQKYGCSYVGECLMKELVSTYTSFDRKFCNGFDFSGKNIIMIYFGGDDTETYLWIPYNLVKEKIPILLKWMDKINIMAEVDDRKHVNYLKSVFGPPGDATSVNYPETRYVHHKIKDTINRLRTK